MELRLVGPGIFVVAWAHLTATYCLENVGTQNHHYSRVEFVQRYRENFDDNAHLDALLQ